MSQLNAGEYDVYGSGINPGYIEARYTDFWGSGASHGDVTPVGVSGNLAVAPFFAEDFRLQPWSDLIDAGEPGTYDLDGSPADLGAYGGPYAWP